MTLNRIRRALGALACVGLALLAGCSASTIESAFKPSRIIVFGDGFSDAGQGANGRPYSVSDTTVDTWAQQLAVGYGLTLTAVVSGGLDYAQGNARVTAADATGGAAPSIQQQITNFLNSGKSFTADDLVVIQGGISDVIAETVSYRAGTQSLALTTANVSASGSAFATQVQRLVSAGAQHVLMVGPYYLSRTPWTTALANGGMTDAFSTLENLSLEFNLRAKVGVAGLGKNVRIFDAAQYMNLVIAFPTTYSGSLTNNTSLACTVTDPANGIGIGLNEVNASLCTAANATTLTDYNTAVFADKIYPTPVVHRLVGSAAYTYLNSISSSF